MSEKLFNWTDKTSTGLVGRELDHLWETAPLTPKYITATISAAQTSNLAVGDHVEFDTVVEDSGHISLSTGAGQADGIFTLPEGIWRIELPTCRVNFSDSAGELQLRFRDDSNTNLGTGNAIFQPPSGTDNFDGGSSTGGIVIVPSASLDIELQIRTAFNVNSIGTPTGVLIFALA